MSAKKWCISLLLLVTLLAGACAQASPTAVVTEAGAAPTTAPTQPPEATKPPEATQPPAPEPTATTATTAEKKVVTFAFTQEFDTLNPAYTNMWFSQITEQLWNCWPWNYDDTGAPVPILVKEMPSTSNGGISADGKVITLKLRDDIVWSDGQPITGDDFVFTYEQYINPKNTVATSHPYELVDKIETPDPQTVVVTFKDPYAPWLGQLFRGGLIPAHVLKDYVDKNGTLDGADWNRNPTVGCGPFNFVKWESGSYADFVANENYWLGRPKLDEIFIRFVPDDKAAEASVETGESDLITFFPISDVPDLKAAGLNVLSGFSGYNEGIYFMVDPKTGHPALQDVKVRQAIAYATDRYSVVKDLLKGATQVAATDWDNMIYVDPSIKPYPFDPEKAKQLLDEAGWKVGSDGVREKDGKKFEITYGTTTREIRKDIQAVFQQQLANVGIKVDLQNYDSDLFFNSYGDNGPAAKGELDIFEYSGQPQFPDPDVGEWLCDQIPTNENPTGTNWMRNCDPELDQLFKDQATQVDPKQRQETFYKITKLIFDKVYWLGIYWDPDYYAMTARLANVKISGATPFYNVMEWDVTQ